MSKKVINKFSERYQGIDPQRGVKLQDSLNGWKYIWKFDPTTVLKLLFGLIVSVLNYIFNRDIFAWYLLSTLVAAHVNFNNSSLEQLCDYLVEDEYDDKIRIIKDYAAANTNLPYLIWLAFSFSCLVEIIRQFI